MGALGEFRTAVRADHATIARYAGKYGGGTVAGSLLGDAVKKVGFQIMIAYRLMRLLRAWRLPLLPMLASRLIRHLYGSDVHWEADFEPGVMVVHGMGLCINGAAHVGSGAILFQHVTLGEGIDPVTREIGAPRLGSDVHVGPGATLVGPIRVAAGTKIAAGVVLMRSVEEPALVEAPEPVVRPRVPGAGRRDEGA